MGWVAGVLDDPPGSDPAQSSLSEAEMDMESSPSSWPKDTNSSMLAGGRKQSSGKETGEWEDGAPTTRRGGAHQRHAGGSEPHPE